MSHGTTDLKWKPRQWCHSQECRNGVCSGQVHQDDVSVSRRQPFPDRARGDVGQRQSHLGTDLPVFEEDVAEGADEDGDRRHPMPAPGKSAPVIGEDPFDGNRSLHQRGGQFRQPQSLPAQFLLPSLGNHQRHTEFRLLGPQLPPDRRDRKQHLPGRFRETHPRHGFDQRPDPPKTDFLEVVALGLAARPVDASTGFRAMVSSKLTLAIR